MENVCDHAVGQGSITARRPIQICLLSVSHSVRLQRREEKGSLMADEALEMKMQVGVNFGEEDTEKWVKYYSSFHQILLVGDGDFSFSICLAQSFGSASNIVASSLDDRGLSLFYSSTFTFLVASHVYGV